METSSCVRCKCCILLLTTEMAIPNSSHLSRKRQCCVYSVNGCPPQRSRPSLDISMVTIGGRGGERRRLWPPPSAHCADTNPASFLVDQRSQCSRNSVSFQLEIKWAKYGPLVLSIQEIIQIDYRSLALLSGGTNILPISVSFVDVSADLVTEQSPQWMQCYI